MTYIGRDIARAEFHGERDTILGNWLFALMIAGAVFYIGFITHRILAAMWVQIAERLQ